MHFYGHFLSKKSFVKTPTHPKIVFLGYQNFLPQKYTVISACFMKKKTCVFLLKVLVRFLSKMLSNLGRILSSNLIFFWFVKKNLKMADFVWRIIVMIFSFFSKKKVCGGGVNLIFGEKVAVSEGTFGAFFFGF